MASCSSRRTTIRGSKGSHKGPYNSRKELLIPAKKENENVDSKGRKLVEAAHRWIGTPYKYGGADKKGADCSGFTMALLSEVCDVNLPHNSSQQLAYCQIAARNEIGIGDLVFFGPSGKSAEDVSHVGLYVGSGKMIHASSSRGVTVSSIDEGYWGARFLSGGHVPGGSQSWRKKAGNIPATTISNEQITIISSPLENQIEEQLDSIFSSSIFD